MDALVDLERLGEYWHHMLSDFPAHPAASDPGHALPISLYGFLGYEINQLNWEGWKNTMATLCMHMFHR